MNKVVEQIHNEFYTASDKLLCEAKKIISSANPEKIALLKQSGFINTKEAKQGDKILISKELAEVIGYYQLNYPLYKFITQDQVELICRKYKLICGPVSAYTGFVPLEKLKQISSFSLKCHDERPKRVQIKKFTYSHQSNLYIPIMSKYPDGIIPASMLKGGPGCRYLEGHIFVEKYDELNEQDKMICAPPKDMNVKGLKKSGSFGWLSFTSVTIPDPVVLQPVKNGFLILAAWGEEASDPIVVNETNN